MIRLWTNKGYVQIVQMCSGQHTADQEDELGIGFWSPSTTLYPTFVVLGCRENSGGIRTDSWWEINREGFLPPPPLLYCEAVKLEIISNLPSFPIGKGSGEAYNLSSLLSRMGWWSRTSVCDLPLAKKEKKEKRQNLICPSLCSPSWQQWRRKRNQLSFWSPLL